MIRISLAVFIFSFLMRLTAIAGEGMWIPLFLKSLNEKEMKGMGMKMSAEDIYSTNSSSLKDAIVHFGGFCTSEIISPNGLMLTNHHCGYGQIQKHSTLEDNILKNGFWASSYEEEKVCAGLRATFIVSIEDVSERVLDGISDDLKGEDRQAAIDLNIGKIKADYDRVNFRDLQVKPFFKGNQYFAIETVTFPDVRLVGTPPESIGKFGADTDNWMWPRHTGDFSFFRIYASPDNGPANYSEDNVPYQPKHFLPISLDGVEEGDFTMVFGFPGRTNEYLPSTAVDQIANVYNPAKIAMRDAALKVMDKAMRDSEELRLQYAPKFARIANYWKKWIGESTGIQKTNAVAKKEEYEKDFAKKVKRKRKFRKKYKNTLPTIKAAYQEIEPYQLAAEISGELMVRNVEVFRQLRQLKLLQGSLTNHGEGEFNTVRQKYIEVLGDWFKTYQADIDKDVLAGQMKVYAEFMPEKLKYKGIVKGIEEHGSAQSFADHLFEQSKVVKFDQITDIINGEPHKYLIALMNDPLFAFYDGMHEHYSDNIAPIFNEKRKEIADMQREYMKAQMDVFRKKRFYPDANSTMRVTYGKAEGYSTEEAGTYDYMTYLDGVIAKYKPGDYEFDLPKRLIQLYEDKDYGPYTASNGKVPVCFIGSNHTSGGNSGSPAIDAYGNLVGLNFDRVWEGTMSDINYDRSICRNIMVDMRYVLFIVDKFAGATNLIDEMKLVRPKSN